MPFHSLLSEVCQNCVRISKRICEYAWICEIVIVFKSRWSFLPSAAECKGIDIAHGTVCGWEGWHDGVLSTLSITETLADLFSL